MNTIHIFGDSHGNANFSNIKYNNVINHSSPSITMYRVGRDGLEYINFKSIKDKDINIRALKECQVPTLNTEQCYKSREYECPIVNGSYLQCTNNYIPKPNEYNADCGNRTFDMVPAPWKISENCYYNKIKFNREKEYGLVKFI
jgi:hypothetical protein